jgi:hypothetical protein
MFVVAMEVYERVEDDQRGDGSCSNPRMHPYLAQLDP